MQTERDQNNRDICELFRVHPEVVFAARADTLGERESLRLADRFQLLSSATRLRLLDALERHRMCVCDLAELLDSTPSAISHQLRVLRQAGLVNYERDGKEVYYYLTGDPLIGVFRCLRTASHSQS